MKRVRVPRAMLLVMRVVCKQEGDDHGSNSDGYKCGGRAMAMRVIAMAMVTMWAMVTSTRLVGNKEGKGKGSM
jgi:hypothetical protein